jgi:hypothetical protein
MWRVGPMHSIGKDPEANDVAESLEQWFQNVKQNHFVFCFWKRTKPFRLIGNIRRFSI